MKIRNGFVSNSSSSSFIVIGKNKDYEPLKVPEYLFYKDKDPDCDCIYIDVPGASGHFEFGWETMRYTGFMDKLNYIGIQALYASEKESYNARNLIERAILEELANPNIRIRWDYNAIRCDSSSEFYAYIDHQSCVYESRTIKDCLSCNDAFESVESMRAFLFNPDSYVQGGNDNAGWKLGDKYCTSLKRRFGKVYVTHQFQEFDEKPMPFNEGTCKYHPEADILFCDDWKDKDGKDFESVEEKHKYFELNPEKDDTFFDGYYFCSKPCDKEDCPFKNRYVIKDNAYIIKDETLKKYIDWNENFK